MGRALVTNNATTTLSGAINAAVTTINLAGGAGALFPTISGSNYFYGTLTDSSGNIEVVKVTARATDALTVTRGSDGTAARSWASGDRFELRPTAALLEEKISTGDIATQADQETATSITTVVTPGRQQYHPSAAKAWCRWNGTGTAAIDVSYNISSLTDNGTGDFTQNFTVAFSTDKYVWLSGCPANVAANSGTLGSPVDAAPLAGAFRARTLNSSWATLDFVHNAIAFFGDQ